MSETIRIIEMGARDGLQNEKTPVSVAGRIAFIEKLFGATSFESALLIQSEYARTSYAGLITYLRKMDEFYTISSRRPLNPLKRQLPISSANK